MSELLDVLKLLDGSISLKFLLETKLQFESFETSDDLLGFQVQKLWSKAVVPNLFWCIPPLAHFGPFHSSPITQFQKGGWKGSNIIFAMTQIAHCTLKHSSIVVSF